MDSCFHWLDCRLVGGYAREEFREWGRTCWHIRARCLHAPLRLSCNSVLLAYMFSDELVALLDQFRYVGSSRGGLTERRRDARSALLPLGQGARVVPLHDDVLALSAILGETARLEVLLLDLMPSHLRRLVLRQFGLGRRLMVDHFWHVWPVQCPWRDHHLLSSVELPLLRLGHSHQSAGALPSPARCRRPRSGPCAFRCRAMCQCCSAARLSRCPSLGSAVCTVRLPRRAIAELMPPFFANAGTQSGCLAI